MPGGVFALALATAFSSMAVVFIAKTFADTVFLSAFGVQYVPHFYVALAISLIGGSTLYGALLRRRAVIAMDVFILAALIAACAAAPWAADLGGGWVFSVAVTLHALPTIASLALWNAATGVATGRRARKFIPRAGAAATLGGMLGGFASSGVVSALGVEALATFAAVIACAALVMRLLLHRTGGGRLAAERPRRQRAGAAPGSARRLIILLAAAAVIEAIVADVIDFGFKRAATNAFDPDQLGVFFALFYGASNTLILLLQLFATTRVLATRALRLTLSIAPFALFLVGGIWAIAPGLVLATIGNAGESVLKFGVSRPGQEIALTPLSPLRRQRWKVLLRGTFNKLGGVVAGVLLIALETVLLDYPIAIPILVASLAVALLIVQRRVAAAYLEHLGSALGLRRLNMEDQPAQVALDREGIARVVAVMGDSNPQLASFGRQLLARGEADAADLAKHLGHHDPVVRRRLYALCEQSPNRGAVDALEVAVVAETPSDPETLTAGLRALAVHGSDAGTTLARAVAGDSEPKRARDHALQGWAYLAEVGAIDDDGATLEDVLGAVLSTDGARAARLYAAAIERRRISASEADNVIANAVERDRGPRGRQAMRAAAALGRFEPLAKLLRALSDGAPGADEAFAHLDWNALFRLVGIVTSRESPPQVRARLLRALRASELTEVADVATTFLTDPEPSVREVAARVLLKQVRERGADVRRSTIEKSLQLELDLFQRYAGARVGFAQGARESLMIVDQRRTAVDSATPGTLFDDEVERRAERALTRLCGTLALLGNPETVYAAERALRSDEFKQRRQGVDVLQEIVRGGQRARLLDLLDIYLLPPTRRKPEARSAVCAVDPWLARCSDGEFDALISRLASLRSTSLFADVDSEALVDLAAATEEQRYEAGDVVVNAGDPGDALFVIMAGAVEVESNGNRIAKLGLGESFGELALLDGRPRTASVRAATPARLLRLPRATFAEAFQTHPTIGLGLVRGLTRWLRNASRPESAALTGVFPMGGTLAPRE